MPAGSHKEALAIEAVLHENLVRYQTTVTMVNAIIAVGNSLAGGSDSNKSVKASLDLLRELLIPGDKARQKNKLKRIKELLIKEAESGPFKVKAMGNRKNRKGSLAHKK